MQALAVLTAWLLVVSPVAFSSICGEQAAAGARKLLVLPGPGDRGEPSTSSGGAHAGLCCLRYLSMKLYNKEGRLSTCALDEGDH